MDVPELLSHPIQVQHTDARISTNTRKASETKDSALHTEIRDGLWGGVLITGLILFFMYTYRIYYTLYRSKIEKENFQKSIDIGTNLSLFHALAAPECWRECGCDEDDFEPRDSTDPSPSGATSPGNTNTHMVSVELTRATTRGNLSFTHTETSVKCS